MASQETLDSIRREIEQAKRIAVVSHIRPDGDAVGSLMGIALALEAAGKEVQKVLIDGTPETLHFVAKSDRIIALPSSPIDLIIVVDASELPRVGKALDGFGVPDINIDHHITNTHFARINLVEPTAAATAEILANILPELGLDITPESAQALLTGILTDTIGFRTAAVTPNTLRLAASLMERGADLNQLYQAALLQRGVNAFRYWGRGLSQIETEGEMVWTTLTLADRQRAGYPGYDDADLINVLSGARGAKVAMIFIEQQDGKIKVSWRARNGYDVSQIALQFGGGGHQAASGAEIKGRLVDVQDQVLRATRHLFA